MVRVPFLSGKILWYYNRFVNVCVMEYCAICGTRLVISSKQLVLRYNQAIAELHLKKGSVADKTKQNESVVNSVKVNR